MRNWILSFLGVCCFVIGLPCWLVGCNPDVEYGCLTRQIINMTYVGKTLETGVCCSECSEERCTSTTSIPTCTTHTYCCQGYSCYSCTYHFETTDGTPRSCTQGCKQVYRTATEALTPTRPLNQTYMFAYDDKTHLCQEADGSKSTWIVGVFFLCLAMSFGMIKFCLYMNEQRKYSCLRNNETMNFVGYQRGYT